MIRCDRLVLTPFISTYNWQSIIENSSVGDSDNYGSTNRRLRFSEFSFQEIHWIFFSYRSNTVKADLTESMNVYTWLFQEVRVFRHLSFFFFFYKLPTTSILHKYSIHGLNARYLSTHGLAVVAERLTCRKPTTALSSFEIKMANHFCQSFIAINIINMLTSKNVCLGMISPKLWRRRYNGILRSTWYLLFFPLYKSE